MSVEKHLAFTISGGGARPSGINLRDLLFLLSELETAIRATAKHIGKSDQSATLSLIEIKTGSAVYDLATSNEAHEAAMLVAHAIHVRTSDTLPHTAIDALHEIHKRAIKMDRSFTLKNESFSSTIQPSIPLFVDSLVQGSTTLFGYLNAVGGTRPTAKLRLSDNRHLTAEVATQTLAQQLGTLLYRYVTLDGDAWWHTSTMDLHRFRIKRVGDYDDRITTPTNAFSSLAEVSPGLWDNIDPDDYMREQRHDPSQ